MSSKKTVIKIKTLFQPKNNIIKELGYKNEIGYQTFLYSSEPDMRRLLMFLIEKLPKDTSSNQDEEGNNNNNKKSKENDLNLLISKKINLMLSQCWTPSYCKQKSVRVIDNSSILKEGCRNIKKFNTVSLVFPSSKIKYTKDSKEYFNKHCLFVTQQVKNESLDLLSSLMQYNTVARLEEQKLLNQDLNANEKKKVIFFFFFFLQKS